MKIPATIITTVRKIKNNAIIMVLVGALAGFLLFQAVSQINAPRLDDPGSAPVPQAAPPVVEIN